MSPRRGESSCMIVGKVEAVLGRDYVSRRHGPRRASLFAFLSWAELMFLSATGGSNCFLELNVKGATNGRPFHVIFVY